jgi:hypothetical protein
VEELPVIISSIAFDLSHTALQLQRLRLSLPLAQVEPEPDRAGDNEQPDRNQVAAFEPPIE